MDFRRYLALYPTQLALQYCQTKLVRALSSFIEVLKTSKDGHCIICLGNLFQCLTVVIGRKFLLICRGCSSLNSSSFNLSCCLSSSSLTQLWRTWI